MSCSFFYHKFTNLVLIVLTTPWASRPPSPGQRRGTCLDWFVNIDFFSFPVLFSSLVSIGIVSSQPTNQPTKEGWLRNLVSVLAPILWNVYKLELATILLVFTSSSKISKKAFFLHFQRNFTQIFCLSKKKKEKNKVTR